MILKTWNYKALKLICYLDISFQIIYRDYRKNIIYYEIIHIYTCCIVNIVLLVITVP